MKIGIKLLTLATSLAAGNSNAAIDTHTTGNGELFFTIWDKAAQIAYTKDLGIKMNDFLPGTGTAANNQSFTLAGDEYWTGFWNFQTATTVWMIGAMDDTRRTTAGGSRHLSTSNSGLSVIRN